jgi:hypothetical protein
MSEAGNATFNGTVTASTGGSSTPSFTFSGDTNTGMFKSANDTIGFTTGGTERVQIGSFGVAADQIVNKTASGDLTIDVAGDIILDAEDNGKVQLHDGGTYYGLLRRDNNDFQLYSIVQDGDMVFRGNDGGSNVTALTLDMSAAGAATFNDAVGIGMAPDSAVKLSVSGAVGPTNGSAGSPTHTFYGDPDTGMFRAAANTLAFSTGGTERMRIQSDGGILFYEDTGSTAKLSWSPSNERLTLDGSDYQFEIKEGSNQPFFLRAVSDGSFRTHLNGTGDITTVFASGAFQLQTANQASAMQTDYSGDDIIFGSSAAGSSNAYFGNLHTADNFFYAANNSSNTTTPPIFVNRQNNDGLLILFRQGNSDEGSIEVSGSTVSLNGFSGKHESSGISTNVEIGTVVSTIDELDVYSDTQPDVKTGEEISNPKAGQTRADHAKVKVSDTVGDKRVYGVVNKFTPENKVMVTSLGIGSVKVTGACNGGDLLESNGDGTAKVQSDDIIRSKTIGKVTIGNTNTGVKLVSCVMYCG